MQEIYAGGRKAFPVREDAMDRVERLEDHARSNSEMWQRIEHINGKEYAMADAGKAQEEGGQAFEGAVHALKGFGRNLGRVLEDSIYLCLYGVLLAILLFLISAFPSYAHTMTAEISSVSLYQDSRWMVHIDLSSSGDSTGTDGKLYVFEIKPYQKDLTGRGDPVLTFGAGGQQSGSFALDAGPGEKRLYSAFVAAVRTEGFQYEIISDRHYITNPEVLAANQDPAVSRGKKGLRVNPNLIGDALELNIKHAGVDIATQLFFGEGISYYYEGKTFDINSQLIEELDREISMLSEAGVTVTAILLNGWNTTVPELNREGISQLPMDQAQYYGFNVETETGFRAVKAMASFLANRYNGRNGHGKITNWVIGNEINNQYWNYMGDYEVKEYAHIFQETFRPFYTAIKSECANDNVMFSIDHYWNMEPEAAPVGKYKAKDVVDWFNYWDLVGGSTNWGLALHPYPYPLTSPEFWDDADSGKVNDSLESPIVNFANLHVITDYMQEPNLRNPSGSVRCIFLTEQGFTATKGGEIMEMQQAAAVAYSYYIVEHNPYIVAYLMSRQEDAEGEAVSGLRFGLSYLQDGLLVHRPAWMVYALIDNPLLSLEASDFAKAILGVNDWSELIPGFTISSQ